MQTDFSKFRESGQLDLVDWNEPIKKGEPMLRRLYEWLIYGDTTEEPEIEENDRTRRLSGIGRYRELVGYELIGGIYNVEAAKVRREV